MLASKSGESRVVQRLLTAGANANIRDMLGRTALHWAAERDHAECVRALVGAGGGAGGGAGVADVEMPDHAGQTAFGVALQAGRTASLAVLVAAGCDRTNVDGLNGTALCLAALRGWAACARLLLGAGDDPDERGFAGVTALIGAASEGHVDTVSDLLEGGADPNLAGRCGFVPLSVTLRVVTPDTAVARHRTVALLIRANADVNMPAPPGACIALADRNCPLSFAVATGYTSLVHMLVTAGSRFASPEAITRLRAGGGRFDPDALLAPVRAALACPASLQSACRLAVRSTLGRRRVGARVAALPLAPSLRRYLMFPELDDIVCRRASLSAADVSPTAVVAALTLSGCSLHTLDGTRHEGVTVG